MPAKNTRRNFVKKTLLGSAAMAAGNQTFETQTAQGEIKKEDEAKPCADATHKTGYNYPLPNFKLGTRLLFQGDSITDMKWGRNQKDRNHYLGHSYVYLLAARLGVEMAARKLEFFNRGMSGHKVVDLKKRWQKDAVDMKPDVLSILIGVNDVGRGKGKQVDYKTWEADYRNVLDQSRAANSQLQLVLLDPFVLRVGRLEHDDAWKQWRGQTNKLGVIVKKLAADYKAVHVETQKVFDVASEKVEPAHWIWDGVHPLPQGHELIARSWLEAVSAGG